MKPFATGLSATVLASGLLAFPTLSAAQQPEASGYAGGALGYFRLNDEDFPNSDDEFKDNRWSWRGHAGVQFNPVFSLEGGYLDYGNLEDGSFRLSADGLFAAAMVHLPLGGAVAPYAKLGQLWWDTERKGPAGFRSTDSGSDTFYGLGIRFGDGPGWQLRLEYDRMALDDTDVDQAAVNLQYRF